MSRVPPQPLREQKHDCACSKFEMTRTVNPPSMESKSEPVTVRAVHVSRLATSKDHRVESEPTKTPAADLAAPKMDGADRVCRLCVADINFGLLMLALFYQLFGINTTSFVIFLYPAAHFMLRPYLRPEDHRHATISVLSMFANPQDNSHLQNSLCVLMEYTLAYNFMREEVEASPIKPKPPYTTTAMCSIDGDVFNRGLYLRAIVVMGVDPGKRLFCTEK
ncbi:hypothetical protein QBC37DRAFT_403107 [Rhypophila decipiens]|uniref:Uncharacterized protein n=1 Tax=Rhypophila decipiens TaxID=261697 RepID=A0AAN7B589_9PEZI|nr:hypothetical protein QBC37DRAFT_403107 [Rhypophila decipiens]